VLPTATLVQRLIADDPPISERLPVGALRSVFLEYRTKEDDPPRRLVYFEHNDVAGAPRRWVYLNPTDPKEPPTKLEIEGPLPIAQFKHRNGTALRPGDVLILRACAHDFDDVSVNKAPGPSPEVRILIVDHSGLELNLNRDLTIIQNTLKEQRDKEQA